MLNLIYVISTSRINFRFLYACHKLKFVESYLTSMNVPRCQFYWIFFDSDCWCIIVVLVLVLHADIILFYVLSGELIAHDYAAYSRRLHSYGHIT